MAERVSVVARGSTRSVMVDARVARALVAKGSFSYATKEVTAEQTTEPAKKVAKKRGAYKRRDMTAEDGG